MDLHIHFHISTTKETDMATFADLNAAIAANVAAAQEATALMKAQHAAETDPTAIQSAIDALNASTAMLTAETTADAPPAASSSVAGAGTVGTPAPSIGSVSVTGADSVAASMSVSDAADALRAANTLAPASDNSPPTAHA